MQRAGARPAAAEAARLIQEVMDNLRRVFQVINDHSKQAKGATGLTGPQLWALKVLAEHGPLRVTDLAARMYLHPSTVVGVLHRLEVRSLVERIRSNSDRRVVHVGLTPAGKSLVLRVPAVARGLRLQVEILKARELTPRLLLSPEVNAPKRDPTVSRSALSPVASPPVSASSRCVGAVRHRRAGNPT